MCQAIKPSVAAEGRVKTQATTRFLARPQRTAERRSVEPTPKRAEEIVCEVEIGAPKKEARDMTKLAEHSAVKPWAGESRKIRLPMVFTIFHPPMAVPVAMARAQDNLTQRGTVMSLESPKVTRASVIMPIVFCASFNPWLKATKLAEQHWSLRNMESTF